MARTTRPTPTLTLAALLAALPLAAHADAWFHAQLLTGASALDGGSQNDFPPELDTGLVPITAVPDSLSSSLTASASAGGASGDGFASGQAELTAPGTFAGAVLRALATSQGIAPHGGPNATSGFGQARTGIRYLDMLHASGAPDGTPVRFRVRLELDGAMARVGQDSANHVQLTWIGGSSIPSAPLEMLTCTNRNGACSRSDTGIVEALVGVPFGVGLELFTQVHASAYLLGPAFASASGEFEDTGAMPPHRGRLCIDVITPGTSYTLDSGGDLRCSASPVAQVPVLPPLALGALVVALAAAGRRALRRA